MAAATAPAEAVIGFQREIAACAGAHAGPPAGEVVSGARMLAVTISGPGGPEVLEIREVPRPEPGPEEVLVRVHASALNRADLLQREGKYPAPPGWPADIPGLEFAGEVEACGERARMRQEGARVFGLVASGAAAVFLTIHDRA